MRDTPAVLDGIPLRIDPAEVRAFVAYRRAPLGDPTELDQRLGGATAEVSAVMRPRLVHRTVAVREAEPDRLVLAEGTIFHIPSIGSHWGPVEAVTAGLVTIGEEPERLAHARREAGDAVGAALLDCAASAAVECLAEWANDHLCQLGVGEGRRATNRISPGLAGWPLAEQGALLALLPAAAVGVRLRAGALMAPAKSISLLIGSGRAARVDHYFVLCRRCWAAACPARRMPAVTTVHSSLCPAGHLASAADA